MGKLGIASYGFFFFFFDSQSVCSLSFRIYGLILNSFVDGKAELVVVTGYENLFDSLPIVDCISSLN